MPFRKTQKRKRRKRGQRGGVLYKISPAVLQRLHKPIGVHAKDCCPCVFKLLGMSEADAQRLATRMPAGFSKDAIVDYFSTMYPKYSFSFQTVRTGGGAAAAGGAGGGGGGGGVAASIAALNVLHKIFSKILPGFGIIGGYERTGGSSHCIAFARDLTGTPVIFDAQAGQLIEGFTAILNYIAHHQIITIWLLRSVTKGTKSSVKMSLILPDTAKAQVAAMLSSARAGLDGRSRVGMIPAAVSQPEIDRHLVDHYHRLGAPGAARAAFRRIQRDHYPPVEGAPIKIGLGLDRGTHTAHHLSKYKELVGIHTAHPVHEYTLPIEVARRHARAMSHPGSHSVTKITMKDSGGGGAAAAAAASAAAPAATGRWHPGSGTYIGKRKQEKKRRANKSLRVNLLQKMRRKTRKKRGMGKKRRRKRRRTKKYRK